ncbi:MAG: glycosyltransferase family 9 protein [Aquificaceae bacterium]|nr:glycosyltransferase family 9 protein [Aquificaceae bacterium]MDW8237734.1 glycosyltransferase family 9 protein [Aquificaceae bacterium]
MVIRLSSLGDVVLTSCLIEPLIKRGFKVSLLTLYPNGEVFYYDERVNLIQVSKKELFSKKILSSIKGYDLYVDLQKNPKTIALRLLLGGKWKVIKKHSIRRRLAIRFKLFRKSYSVLEAYLKTIGEREGRLNLGVDKELLEKFKNLVGGDYICIAPGARYYKKRYPYFNEVCKELSSMGYKVVLVGSEEDNCSCDKSLNLCGKVSLRELPALIAGAKLLVGNDSAPVHIARAVGTKVVQIFGATHPTLGFGVSSSEGEVLIKGLDCQPCDLHGKGSCKRGDLACLEIEPKEVIKACIRLLPS